MGWTRVDPKTMLWSTLLLLPSLSEKRLMVPCSWPHRPDVHSAEVGPRLTAAAVTGGRAGQGWPPQCRLLPPPRASFSGGSSQQSRTMRTGTGFCNIMLFTRLRAILTQPILNQFWSKLARIEGWGRAGRTQRISTCAACVVTSRTGDLILSPNYWGMGAFLTGCKTYHF